MGLREVLRGGKQQHPISRGEMPALATATKETRTVVYGYAKTEKSKYYLLIETD